MTDLALKNLQVISEARNASIKAICADRVVWSVFTTDAAREGHNVCWMPIVPEFSETVCGQVRGLRIPSESKIEAYSWIRPIHQHPSSVLRDMSITRDGCLNFTCQTIKSIQPVSILDDQIDIGSVTKQMKIKCEHSCNEVFLWASNALYSISSCFLLKSSSYELVLFQNHVFFLGNNARHLVAAAPRELFKIEFAPTFSSYRIGAMTHNDPKYSVVSHVWGRDTVKNVTHMWGVKMPDYVTINRNLSKRIFMRWLYSRDERVWMDIFNNNQHDKRVQSAQVAVMDILYARAERCYLVVECPQAGLNFDKALEKFSHSRLPLIVTGSELDIQPVIFHDDWSEVLEFVLNKTEYRGRVWTLQEELVSKNKVLVIAPEDYDAVYIASSSFDQDLIPNYERLTKEKLAECSELYKNALRYRKTGDIGYNPATIRAQTLIQLRNYDRQCYRPVDHVFAVYRLLGIEMETDYHDDPEKILQEWQIKLLQAGILMLPHATHSSYRITLKTDSCWKSLYWVPWKEEIFKSETPGSDFELHIEDVGPLPPPKD
ncbi:hypothetical protein BCR33DRAFT_307391 [Rhizoclosmatium globosum]|uniref:Heterokaryon incompatibility domain-containing protein n=1 Tax=Rhizoclosmatium globosum TaxID=329046 RepID=A0A1Y2C5J0_9FUNG|nr:hypothetical protein BCR33DRAFT_307391 [Rhizoclosmatium globosum]|eukprot:ORY42312.1 hypothetical protein BCR33DRAFT_307391 [Rhizoclosmatium globosum]